MRKLFLITLLFLYSSCFVIFSQEVTNERNYPQTPEYFIPRNHDPNFLKLNKLPSKSFYESKSDWQHIIDSTWGPGDPLPQKLLLFNTYAQKIHDKFDGFLSLQLNWDSLYLFYLNQINDSTSKGAFSSIMSHFSYSLKDLHTRAVDTTVVLSPLNPGVPILLLGNLTVEHFGAVTTILPDSTTLILRVVPNHPLNLEPGDIILGYEGVPWKDLVQELFEAGLPMFAYTGGCESANTYLSLFGAGINWHLFSTIDILKYSTGDTVHLSVLPLLNLNVPPMPNNAQLPIPNIPFPDVINNQCVTYGLLENTNIGYIYLVQEWPEAVADYQFYEAVNSLKNTDALIIDMRLNYGGWALFDNAFSILFNESQNTLDDAYRCNSNTFELCPSNYWWTFYRIKATGQDFYDRPIAVLLGPTCVSMGDITAQRFRYHPMIRFFGASPDASLGYNEYIEIFPGWYLRYSTSDMFHLSKPDEYLNRSEFPIDFPVWHNPDDVAIGNDAVVENALYWIDNVVYPHNAVTDKTYYLSSQDTVHLSTTIENPNSHQLSARAYLKTVEGVLIDSVDLAHQLLNPDGEQWVANFILPPAEELYKISVTSFDQTASTSFTVPNATRITTAGPLNVDSIESAAIPNFKYTITPFIKNGGNSLSISGIKVGLYTNDSWVTSIYPPFRTCPDLLPGEIKSIIPPFAVTYDSAAFPGYFNLNFKFTSDGWTYWVDSVLVIVPPSVVENELNELPTEFSLSHNYPNPFNPSTVISYQLPIGGNTTIRVYDILGNEIATLVDEFKPAGRYEVEFNASILSSGVYFYQLKAGSFVETKKMLLLK